MNKKYLKNLTILVLLMFFSITSVFAAPYDLKNINDSEKVFTFFEFIDSPSVFDEIVSDLNNYVIESEDGNLYYVTDVNDATLEGLSFNEAVEDLSPYNDNLRDVSAKAYVLGSVLDEFNYAVVLYGAIPLDVEYLMINGDIVESKIVDGILRVDSTEDITSMKLIIEGSSLDVAIGDTLEEELDTIKAEVNSLTEEDYLEESWDNLEDTLSMSESTDKEKILKIKAINIALESLTYKVQFIGTFNEFFYDKKEFEGYKGIESLSFTDVYNIYIDEEKLEQKGIDISEELNIKLKLDGNFLIDNNSNETFTYYSDRTTSFYFLPGVEEINNYWTEITPENLGVKYKIVTHPGEIYIINE